MTRTPIERDITKERTKDAIIGMGVVPYNHLTKNWHGPAGLQFDNVGDALTMAGKLNAMIKSKRRQNDNETMQMWEYALSTLENTKQKILHRLWGLYSMDTIRRTKATGLAICGLTQCTNKLCRKRDHCQTVPAELYCSTAATLRLGDSLFEDYKIWIGEE